MNMGCIYVYIPPPEPIVFEAGHTACGLFGMPEGVKAVREFSFASAPQKQKSGLV